MMILISMICFGITELQPCDFVSQTWITQDIAEQIRLLRALGLDKPVTSAY